MGGTTRGVGREGGGVGQTPARVSHSPMILFNCIMVELARMRCTLWAGLGVSPSSNTSSYLSLVLSAAAMGNRLL